MTGRYKRYMTHNKSFGEIIEKDEKTNRLWKYNKNVSEHKRKYYNRLYRQKDLEVMTSNNT